MKSKSCFSCANVNCLVRQSGIEQVVQAIDEQKTQSLYKRNQYIFTEGSPVLGAYFIYSGKVKVVSEGYQGKEQVVRLANDGHIVGHAGEDKEVYPIGAAALERTVVCFVDNQTLREVFHRFPEFTFHAMQFYARELRRIEHRIKYLSQMTVKEKVCESLLYLIDLFGIEEETNRLNVVLSRGELAGLAGTNADQVSRVISELKKDGLIATAKKSLIINDLTTLATTIRGFNALSTGF